MRCPARRPPVRGIRRIGFSAAPSDEHSPQSCVGGSDHLHADDARLSYTCSRSWTGPVAESYPGGCPIRCPPTAVWKRGRTRSPLRQTGPLQHGPRRHVHPPRCTGLLANHGIQSSMDGKGCWPGSCIRGTVLESVHYAEVYRREAQKGLERYVMRYIQRRPHTALDGTPPGRGLR